MPKEKLISVREASFKSGIAEETILKQLKLGRIRGEKKNYLLWDEWFVTLKEVSKLKNTQSASQTIVPSVKQEGESTQEGGTTTATLVAETVSEDELQAAIVNHNVEVAQELAEEIDRAFGPNTFAEAFASHEQALLEPNSSPLEGSAEIAVIEKEAYADSQQNGDADKSPEAWKEYRQRAKTVAEEFLAPLLARLEMQANLLHEKDVIIAEQSAQLRLLPDFQRQTEESMLLAQAKEKETFELRQSLMWERKKALIKLSSWQMKHLRAQKQMKEAAEELAAIQGERETEVNYLHGQLTELQSQLIESQKPWWKKIFKTNQP